MTITWLGHSAFRIEIGGHVLLVDPWLDGNPAFPQERRAEAIAGATHTFVTHGHGDHVGDSVAISRELGIPVHGMVELAGWLAAQGITTVGFNRGGTIDLGGVRVTLVNAVHSSSIGTDAGAIYAGGECGYMIAGEGHTIYMTGDTDIMADMGWMGEYHRPDIGILCCGGFYTMDMDRAAFAAKKYFDFKVVIPCHYKTFPALAQSAEPLARGLPGVDVKTPGVMEPVEIRPA